MAGFWDWLDKLRGMSWWQRWLAIAASIAAIGGVALDFLDRLNDLLSLPDNARTLFGIVWRMIADTNPLAWALLFVGLACLLVASYDLWGPRLGHSQAPKSNQKLRSDDIPDWPIANLFSHIDPNVLEGDPNASRWETVGQQIRDALGLGRLKSWGRPLDTGVEQHGAHAPVPPPKRIRPQYWQNADFTYTFFDVTRPFGVADTIVNGPSRLPNYFDLRVNRAKATELWPKTRAMTEVDQLGNRNL